MVAITLIYNEEVEKVEEFIIVCRLYSKMKIRNITIKEQIQWILFYMQKELADMWKENILEDLETEIKKKIWEKRWRSSKSSKTQKRKTRGKNYERIYIGI